MVRLLLGLFILLNSFTAFSNSIVKGVVLDKTTGEPLQGATIKIKNEKDEKIKFSTLAGLNGHFAFKNIPDGEYEIEAKFIGYKEEEQKITISEGKVVELSFGLEVKSRDLEDVKVMAKSDKGSDAASLLYERKADYILNTISARSIEISPDITVANAIQRISGVSLERSSNGEGQYAIVRGMDKRYNTTLVNGIKIPSPDNKNRYIPLDIFPADLMDRLEITKALTPNMEGDAIGGVVNMIMKDAPSVFTLKVNAGTGYAQSYFSGNKFSSFDNSASSKNSPRYTNGNTYLATMKDFPLNSFVSESSKPPLATVLGFSAGGRLLNNKLGVMVAASYQNTYRNVKSLFFDTETNRDDNTTTFKSVQRRTYSIQQQRTGFHTKLDYVLNKNNKISLYGAFLNLGQFDYRTVSDTNLVLGRNPVQGLGTGRIGNSYRSTKTVQQIANFTLQGDHKVTDDFNIGWVAVYSKASSNQPDRASLETTVNAVRDQNGAIQVAPTFVDRFNTRTWSHNSDEDKAGYLNLTYKSKIFDTKVEWSAGGMYRDKDRDSRYDEYRLNPLPNPQEYTGDASKNTFDVDNKQGTGSDNLNYTSAEKVSAYYGMAKFKINDLQVTGGVRIERTDLSWHTAAPVEDVDAVVGSIKYTDVLPSVHLKYALSKKENLRLSYYSAISRPGFYEVIPHVGGDPDADYMDMGNAYLKRTTAENFDIRYELFPKGLNQLLVGAFYKRIKNPIEYTLTADNGVKTYYKPQNFGNGYNYGFELDYTQYFNKFGVKLNYTFTNSKITTDKRRLFKDQSANQTFVVEQQSRPLQGQSKHIANLSLLYKDGKSGLDVQLAGIYTGRRINTVSPFLDNDIWQKGFIQLDLSVEKRLFKRFYGYAKINNILNTPYELMILQNNQAKVTGVVPEQVAGERINVRKDTYEANYLLGVRFKL